MKNASAFLLLSFSALALPLAAMAQTWSGGSSALWSDSGNWSTAPSSGTSTELTFGGSGGSSQNDLGAFAFKKLIFNTASGAWTISGDALSANGTIENKSAETQTFQAAVTIDKTTTITASGGPIVFEGALSSADASQQFSHTGPYPMILKADATLSPAGEFIGTGDVIIDGCDIVDPRTGDYSAFKSVTGGHLVIRNGGSFTTRKIQQRQGDQCGVLVEGWGPNGERSTLTCTSGGIEQGTYSSNNSLFDIGTGGEGVFSGGFSLGKSWQTPATNSIVRVRDGGRLTTSGSIKIGQDGAVAQGLIVEGRDPVTSEPSLWNANGQQLNFGWGDANCVSNFVIIRNGAVVTNLNLSNGGHNNTKGKPMYQRIEITDGGVLYGTLGTGCYEGSSYTLVSSGAKVIGITGGLRDFNVGRNGDSSDNLMVVDGCGIAGGTMVTNVKSVTVAWVEDTGSTRCMSNNVLRIVGGGQVFGSQDSTIGRVYAWDHKTNLNSRIEISGTGSLLHLAGCSLSISSPDNAEGFVSCDHALRVADRGLATSIKNITVGATGSNLIATNNAVELAGGTVECTNLYVRAGNVLAADVAAYGAEDTPMTVAGTAEFANGSLVRPLPFATTPNSDWRVILRAKTLRDQGVALDPAYAECYRLDVDTAAGTISLRYLPPSTVVLVR